MSQGEAYTIQTTRTLLGSSTIYRPSDLELSLETRCLRNHRQKSYIFRISPILTDSFPIPLQ